MGDGVRVEADDVNLEDSWIDGLVRVAGGHHDLWQIPPRRPRPHRREHPRRLQVPSPGDPDGDYFNAAMQFGSPIDPTDLLDAFLLEGNYLNGGNYTINAGGP